MDEKKLKEAFENHMASRECERPSKSMLFELFVEGFKMGRGSVLSDAVEKCKEEKKKESKAKQ